MTASQVSQAFSAVLDQVENDETIVITRAGLRIATISPTSAASWGRLRMALADWVPASDPAADEDALAVKTTVTLDKDPWQNA